MATNAEKLEHAKFYDHYLLQANTEIAAGNYFLAVQYCVASFEYINLMMQHEQKQNDREFETIETIEIVLKYAPALFDAESLASLAKILKSQKRIDKHATDDLAAKTSEAIELIQVAYTVWNKLQNNTQHNLAQVLKSVSAESLARIEEVVRIWSHQGYVQLHQLEDEIIPCISNPQEVSVKGKCPSCGVLVNGKKYHFWRANKCPKCHKESVFVIMATA